MYANGTGVAKDNTKAMEWFRKAAEQGHAFAQYDLGFMYANGIDVPTDNAKAMEWLRKAADQGHNDAQRKLDAMKQAKVNRPYSSQPIQK